MCHPEVVGKGPVAVPRRQEAKGDGQLQARPKRAATPETYNVLISFGWPRKSATKLTLNYKDMND